MSQDPYLSKQLIAYIGNKRSLAPFLQDIFRRLNERSPIRTFLDPFAGSGAVSRLAKRLGFRVMANDWEPYSRILNEAHVAIDASDLSQMFSRFGGISGAIEWLHGRDPSPGYIAENFAPADTETADYRRERLFYTRENAVFIDTVRDEIERLYGAPREPRLRREKDLLLALLLYQAATHANTSGVFKAYHKGFGGHGREALRRIMSPMRLQHPVLVDGAYRCTAANMDAARFCTMHTADCVYLDPPYNSHQYGSNYFMLNTIAFWDKPVVSNERTESGTLKRKAGIREDWVRTKSAFCYRQSAGTALDSLLDTIDSRFIVLSYNNDGLLGFDEMIDMLAKHGAVELHGSDYVSYRGGRQSPAKSVASAELAVVVDRSRATTSADRRRVRRRRLEQCFYALQNERFDPVSVRAAFPCEYERVRLFREAKAVSMPDHYQFSEAAEIPKQASVEEIEAIVQQLERCRFTDAVAEARLLIAFLSNGTDTARVTQYCRRLISCIRKSAHKKYEAEFRSIVAEAHSLAERRPQLATRLRAELEAVKERFRRRVAG